MRDSLTELFKMDSARDTLQELNSILNYFHIDLQLESLEECIPTLWIVIYELLFEHKVASFEELISTLDDVLDLSTINVKLLKSGDKDTIIRFAGMIYDLFMNCISGAADAKKGVKSSHELPDQSYSKATNQSSRRQTVKVARNVSIDPVEGWLDKVKDDIPAYQSKKSKKLRFSKDLVQNEESASKKKTTRTAGKLTKLLQIHKRVQEIPKNVWQSKSSPRSTVSTRSRGKSLNLAGHIPLSESDQSLNGNTNALDAHDLSDIEGFLSTIEPDLEDFRICF